MITPRNADSADSLIENQNASWFWPRNASLNDVRLKLPDESLNAWPKTLSAGTMRNAVTNAKNGTRPSHAQLRRALGAALEARPPSAWRATVTSGGQASATIGPQLSWST